VEVQIRTTEMHQVRKYGNGIAATLKYKEGGSPGHRRRRHRTLSMAAVSWFDWQQDGAVKTAADYLAFDQEDLFDEGGLCFTPKAIVVGLRTASTAVIFAYRIHVRWAITCQGVRINDPLCPLATRCRR